MSVDEATLQRLRGFVEVWKDRPDDERHFTRHPTGFLIELCQALGTAGPDDVDFALDRRLPGAGDRGVVDAYKRGHFMIDAKRARSSSREVGSTPDRGDALAYTEFIHRAHANLRSVHRRMTGEPPPLLIVVDVGYRLWIWPAFDGEVPDFWSPERIVIAFADLAEPRNAELLLACFERPERLDRRKRRQAVSEKIATRLAELGRELEGRYDKTAVADFTMRVLFCLFADAAGLLPSGLMPELCSRAAHDPEGSEREFVELFAAMREGGRIHGHRLERFGDAVVGKGQALPLSAAALSLLAELCELDWQHLDPAIFGTLLERALDERERRRLGAHYTPRAYVERLVAATLEPLVQDWKAVQVEFALRSRGLREPASRRQLRGLVESTLVPFHAELVALRVLDPACGTGNFLTIAYQRVAAIDQEYRALIGQLLGDQQVIEESLEVQPGQFIGLEKNPWAAEIAQLVLFIGHVQVWLERTGIGSIGRDEHGRRAKVIAALASCKRSITIGDAVIGDDGSAPAWPPAHYIVGNPPYIGNKQMREVLGNAYVDRLRRAYPEVPHTVDLVMFWWYRAAQAVADGSCRCMGLITTNSIRQTQNRPVVRAALAGKRPLRLAWAIADHPWIDRGAQVRISMMVVEPCRPDDPRAQLGVVIDERADPVEVQFTRVDVIHADLQAALDLESAEPLLANEGMCFQGMNLVGKQGFVLSAEQVVQLGYALDDLPRVIRPYLGGREFLHARRGEYVIDAFGLSADELAELHPQLHAWLSARVRPERERNARAAYRDRWWVFGEPRGRLRAALLGLDQFIVTNETARVRTFERVDAETVPDHQLYAIASDDPFVLGVLMSTFHRAWALAKGGRQGVGNDPRYNSTQCFSTFPFPDPPSALRDRIGVYADAIDIERKRLRAEDPAWTLAKIHARLDALQAEETIGDARWGTLLGQIEMLDHQVGRAYEFEARGNGLWRMNVDGPFILAQLLKLNHDRRAEERAGRIRGLSELAVRAEEQSRLGFEELDWAELVVDEPVPTPWPRDPKARLQAIVKALASTEIGLHAEQLAARFSHVRPKSALRDYLEVLDRHGIIEQRENRWTLVDRTRSSGSRRRRAIVGVVDLRQP